MLLTITTTYQPATDLGHLLHKNPSKCQTFEESFGNVHVDRDHIWHIELNAPQKQGESRE